ncbi:hypothetical protein TPA0598_06_04260 [Streptomyces lydicamycinicus]|uniref:Uncharacterized protein n=1 Tax=Streptomyces lydicamycinicus TaxID=1546107 RepID=A0A0P4RC65_9ACTN|nr:hypothetical protein TPA0598_06_04260 [Streptomyces lydicamycinicus]
MEEPTSGPEPEAPAQAAPGDPTEPVEPKEPWQREGSGAVSTAGGVPAGLVGSDGAAGPDDVAEPRGGAERGGAAESEGADGAGSGAERVEAAEPGGGGRPGAAGEPEGPAEPQPIGVDVTPTGEAAVDARLRRLADADHLPASEHLQVYEDVHRGLRDVLAGLDQHPGPPAPSSTTHDNRS